MGPEEAIAAFEAGRLLLAPEEVEELTGYKLPAHQLRWCKAQGFRARMGGDGRVKLARAHVLQHMGLVDSTPKPEPELRF